MDPGTAAPLPAGTMPTILCCLCGQRIAPNPVNMCVTCLSSRVDITDGIPKQLVLQQCRECHRYNRPPWISCELESKELLAMCLKKITGLNKVKLVDAGFVWTEPHSRRIKVKLTIQKEIDSGAKLQQAFVVEFAVQNQQCDDCQRSYTTHTWNSCVQVRQKVDHKKTFLYLEQVILKHGVHKTVSEIKQVAHGLDFFFKERSHAVRFCDFLSSVIPCKMNTSKQLISQDIQNGTARYKHTFAVDIVPVCKDDLVVLPAKLAAAVGGIARMCLVHRVSTYVYLVDPTSLHTAEVPADKFWRTPFTALMPCTRLVEFTVLDVTPVPMTDKLAAAMARRRKDKRHGRKRAPAPDLPSIDEGGFGAGPDHASVASKMRRKNSSGDGVPAAAGGAGGEGGHTAASLAGSALFSVAGSKRTGAHTARTGYSVTSTVTGGPRGKYLLAEVEVARTSDLGVNDTRYTTVSHMGNLLKAGDTVMGYDLSTAVFSEGAAEELPLPDVVLVRKVYARDPKKRNWRLKRLNMRVDEDAKGRADRSAEEEAAQEEDFLRDVEEDGTLRSAMNLFKASTETPEAAAAGGAGDDAVDEGAEGPSVPTEELLDDLADAFGAAMAPRDDDDDDDDDDEDDL